MGTLSDITAAAANKSMAGFKREGAGEKQGLSGDKKAPSPAHFMGPTIASRVGSKKNADASEPEGKRKSSTSILIANNKTKASNWMASAAKRVVGIRLSSTPKPQTPNTSSQLENVGIPRTSDRISSAESLSQTERGPATPPKDNPPKRNALEKRAPKSGSDMPSPTSVYSPFLDDDKPLPSPLDKSLPPIPSFAGFESGDTGSHTLLDLDATPTSGDKLKKYPAIFPENATTRDDLAKIGKPCKPVALGQNNPFNPRKTSPDVEPAELDSDPKPEVPEGRGNIGKTPLLRVSAREERISARLERSGKPRRAFTSPQVPKASHEMPKYSASVKGRSFTTPTHSSSLKAGSPKHTSSLKKNALPPAESPGEKVVSSDSTSPSKAPPKPRQTRTSLLRQNLTSSSPAPATATYSRLLSRSAPDARSNSARKNEKKALSDRKSMNNSKTMKIKPKIYRTTVTNRTGHKRLIAQDIERQWLDEDRAQYMANYKRKNQTGGLGSKRDLGGLVQKDDRPVNKPANAVVEPLDERGRSSHKSGIPRPTPVASGRPDSEILVDTVTSPQQGKDGDEDKATTQRPYATRRLSAHLYGPTLKIHQSAERLIMGSNEAVDRKALATRKPSGPFRRPSMRTDLLAIAERAAVRSRSNSAAQDRSETKVEDPPRPCTSQGVHSIDPNRTTAPFDPKPVVSAAQDRSENKVKEPYRPSTWQYRRYFDRRRDSAAVDPKAEASAAQDGSKSKPHRPSIDQFSLYFEQVGFSSRCDPKAITTKTHTRDQAKAPIKSNSKSGRNEEDPFTEAKPGDTELTEDDAPDTTDAEAEALKKASLLSEGTWISSNGEKEGGLLKHSVSTEPVSPMSKTGDKVSMSRVSSVREPEPGSAKLLSRRIDDELARLHNPVERSLQHQLTPSRQPLSASTEGSTMGHMTFPTRGSSKSPVVDFTTRRSDASSFNTSGLLTSMSMASDFAMSQDFSEQQTSLGAGLGLECADISYEETPILERYDEPKRTSVAGTSTHSSTSISKGMLRNVRGLFRREKTQFSDDSHGQDSEKFKSKHLKAKPKSKPTIIKTDHSSAIPDMAAIHPVHRPEFSPNPCSPNLAPVSPYKLEMTTPVTPAKVSFTDREIAETTAMAMDILDKARLEPDSPKRERLLEIGRIMVAAITQVRDAQKAVEEAKQAARKAEVSHMLCVKNVAEVARSVQAWRGEMEAEGRHSIQGQSGLAGCSGSALRSAAS